MLTRPRNNLLRLRESSRICLVLLLSWQNNNGVIQYSNILSIKNNVPLAISNFLLRANGELSFLCSGNSAGNYSFRLLSSDGKVLSQAKEQSYSPGRNKIYICKKPVLNNFVYLTVHSNKLEKTTFLRVAK